MTIGELIQELSQYDNNCEVLVIDDVGRENYIESYNIDEIIGKVYLRSCFAGKQYMAW